MRVGQKVGADLCQMVLDVPDSRVADLDRLLKEADRTRFQVIVPLRIIGSLSQNNLPLHAFSGFLAAQDSASLSNLPFVI